MNKTIYFGGPIITMEPDSTPSALLVEGGKIRKLGEKEELLALCPDAQLYDLKGHTLLPAFIDPHSHITSFANTLGLVDLDDVGSFDEIAQRIDAYRKERNIQPGQWIIGRGYDHNTLEEGRHPDKFSLDKAAPQNPVLIAHRSGHMGVANSLGLQELGIDASTENPSGGMIGRVEGSKEPSGYLEENAFIVLASSRMPRPSLEQLMDQMEEAQNIYASFGITTAQDGATRAAEWKLLESLAQQGRLKLDTIAYVDLKNAKEVMEGNPSYIEQYHNHLKIGAYKIFLDGSPQGRTAWMTKPYLGGDADYKGYPIYDDATVEGFMETALKEGRQILAHCNGDAASDQMIHAYKAAAQKLGEPADGRPVMIHCQLTRGDQLAEMAKLGMVASIYVAHTYYWGDVHLKNFGEERGGHVSPAGSAIRNHVVYTFHQDTPVLLPDMITTLWCAVNRVTRAGVPLAEEEKVSVYDALKGITCNAAYQYFEEDRKGSLKEGKLADLVILDQNPLEIDPKDLRSIQVLSTIKEGEPIYTKA